MLFLSVFLADLWAFFLLPVGRPVWRLFSGSEGVKSRLRHPRGELRRDLQPLPITQLNPAQRLKQSRERGEEGKGNAAFLNTQESDLFYSKMHISCLVQATCNLPRGTSQTQAQKI